MMDFREFQTIEDIVARRHALSDDLSFVDAVITAYGRVLDRRENPPAASLEMIASRTSGAAAGATEGRDKTQPQYRRDPSSPARLTIIDPDTLGRERKPLRSSERERPITVSRRSPAADQVAAEDVMKGLKADWRRWTRIERIAAVCIAVAMSSMVPALLLFEQG
jgi:hypothetical protein